MVDRNNLIELVPHYVAIVVLVLAIMSIIRAIFDLQHILVEFALILILVFSYRPLIARIDAIPTPEVWKPREEE